MKANKFLQGQSTKKERDSVNHCIEMIRKSEPELWAEEMRKILEGKELQHELRTYKYVITALICRTDIGKDLDLGEVNRFFRLVHEYLG